MHGSQSVRDLAPSGLATAPALSWGSHVGHLFDTDDELETVLVPFFKAGLENNESCLWVTASPLDAEQARAALCKVVPDLEERERKGQIEIQNGELFYEPGQPLVADELVAGLIEREELALSSGYKGLRTNGNCAWVGHEEWPAFGRYETLVHQKIRGRRMICMCSYKADKLQSSQVVDVIDRHDLIVRHSGSDADAAAASVADFAALAMPTPRHDFQEDLDAIAAIESIPTLLKTVSEITGMGFSAVARVTEHRWICLASHDRIGFGLSAGGELPVESTLCQEIWESHEAIVINDVSKDAVYAGHHTPATYGLQSYISVPIMLRGGGFYGTLCAIDPHPAELDTPKITSTFRAFADLIAFQLEAGNRLASVEASLIDARAAAKLHDQFVAVLGHDLRNPIAAILSGVRLLERNVARDKAERVIDGIGKSAARMAELVDNIIDLTRGQLGTGLSLRRTRGDLEPALRHVLDEARLAHPGCVIEAEMGDLARVDADAGYLGRLLSNLVTNAVKYGSAGRPVRVRAIAADDFILSVTNGGEAIRPEIMQRLFAPFTRGDIRPDQQGLGLGLYIVAEIARAHGGNIEVTSTDAETRFTFRMPIG